MRPYLVLTAVVLMAVAAFGQQPFPHSGSCLYGCGPYIPLVTTPQISLQTVSPNPVGATNATTGLIAGATNSTLSEIQGSTSSEYPVAVWYQGGGAPLTTPGVHLYPEPIGREGRVMRGGMREERMQDRPREERAREMRPREGRPGEVRSREEHGQRPSEEARGDWTYVNGPTTAASGVKKAARVYNNDDVKRQNDKNGVVKYDGKTEKI
jgi:hypothetical protein